MVGNIVSISNMVTLYDLLWQWLTDRGYRLADLQETESHWKSIVINGAAYMWVHNESGTVLMGDLRLDATDPQLLEKFEEFIDAILSRNNSRMGKHGA